MSLQRINDLIYNEDDAMDNAFEAIIHDASVIDLVDKSDYLVAFPFDPWNVTVEDITDMERHYIVREEYERCATLRDYKLYKV